MRGNPGRVLGTAVLRLGLLTAFLTASSQQQSFAESLSSLTFASDGGEASVEFLSEDTGLVRTADRVVSFAPRIVNITPVCVAAGEPADVVAIVEKWPIAAAVGSTASCHFLPVEFVQRLQDTRNARTADLNLTEDDEEQVAARQATLAKGLAAAYFAGAFAAPWTQAEVEELSGPTQVVQLQYPEGDVKDSSSEGEGGDEDDDDEHHQQQENRMVPATTACLQCSLPPEGIVGDVVPVILLTANGSDTSGVDYYVAAGGTQQAIRQLTVHSAAPASGPVSGGTRVLIQGEGTLLDAVDCYFLPAVGSSFSGPARLPGNLTLISDTVAECVAPSWPEYLQRSTGGSSNSSDGRQGVLVFPATLALVSGSGCEAFLNFDYFADPDIAAVSPTRTPANKGFELLVSLDTDGDAFGTGKQQAYSGAPGLAPRMRIARLDSAGSSKGPGTAPDGAYSAEGAAAPGQGSGLAGEGSGVYGQLALLDLEANLTLDGRALVAWVPPMLEPGEYAVAVSLNGQQFTPLEPAPEDTASGSRSGGSAVFSVGSPTLSMAMPLVLAPANESGVDVAVQLNYLPHFLPARVAVVAHAVVVATPWLPAAAPWSSANSSEGGEGQDGILWGAGVELQSADWAQGVRSAGVDAFGGALQYEEDGDMDCEFEEGLDFVLEPEELEWLPWQPGAEAPTPQSVRLTWLAPTLPTSLIRQCALVVSLLDVSGADMDAVRWQTVVAVVPATSVDEDGLEGDFGNAAVNGSELDSEAAGSSEALPLDGNEHSGGAADEAAAQAAAARLLPQFAVGAPVVAYRGDRSVSVAVLLVEGPLLADAAVAYNVAPMAGYPPPPVGLLNASQASGLLQWSQEDAANVTAEAEALMAAAEGSDAAGVADAQRRLREALAHRFTLDLDWEGADVPPEAAIRLAVTLQPVWNAMLHPAGGSGSVAVFGVDRGTCPPGTRRNNVGAWPAYEGALSGADPRQEWLLQHAAVADGGRPGVALGPDGPLAGGDNRTGSVLALLYEPANATLVDLSSHEDVQQELGAMVGADVELLSLCLAGLENAETSVDVYAQQQQQHAVDSAGVVSLPVSYLQAGAAVDQGDTSPVQVALDEWWFDSQVVDGDACTNATWLLPLQPGQNRFSLSIASAALEGPSSVDPVGPASDSSSTAGDAVQYNLSIVRLAPESHARLASLIIKSRGQIVTVCGPPGPVVGIRSIEDDGLQGSVGSVYPGPPDQLEVGEAGPLACRPDVPMEVTVGPDADWASLQPVLLHPDIEGTRVEINGQVLSRGGDAAVDRAIDTTASSGGVVPSQVEGTAAPAPMQSNDSYSSLEGMLPEAFILGLQKGVPVDVEVVVVAEDAVTSSKYLLRVVRSDAEPDGNVIGMSVAPLPVADAPSYWSSKVLWTDTSTLNGAVSNLSNSIGSGSGSSTAHSSALASTVPYTSIDFSGYGSTGWQVADGCSACPAGWSSEQQLNSSRCSMCPPGSFSPEPMSGSCTQCEPGTYSFSWGASYCKHCVVGTYSPRPGSPLCVLCPEHTTTSSDGSSTCDVPVLPGVDANQSYALIVRFGVMLHGASLDEVLLRAGAIGAPSSVVASLVRSDTAAGFNVSVGDVHVLSVTEVARRQLRVNVTATLPVEPSENATRQEVEAAMLVQELSADDSIEMLSKQPAQFFDRTIKALGVTAETDDYSTEQSYPMDGSNSGKEWAYLWLAVVSSVAVVALLGYIAAQRVRRRRAGGGVPGRPHRLHEDGAAALRDPGRAWWDGRPGSGGRAAAEATTDACLLQWNCTWDRTQHDLAERLGSGEPAAARASD